MSKVAQILSALVALIFVALAAFNIFNPIDAAAVRALDPIGEAGMTNTRLLGAPLLMIALAAVAAAVKKNPTFLGPAVLYLMFSIVITLGSFAVDGTTSETLLGLGVTFALLIFAEIPVQLFNRAQKVAAA